MEKQEVEILLPKMGESVMEATIVEWLKEIGDTVSIDDELVLIGTDKVESELPSEFEGVLSEILIQNGEIVEVGKPIAKIQLEKTVLNPQEPTIKTQKIVVETVEEKSILSQSNLPRQTQNGKIFLSPVVRKIAMENNIELSDIEKITGSGNNQRIKKSDILSYLNPTKAIKKPKKKNLKIEMNDQVKPLSRIREITANHLSESYQNIPHVTTFVKADVTKLVEYRDANKKQWQDQHQIKITYTHFMMYLMIENLKKYPIFNSWMNENEIIFKNSINLGFATATPDGNLIVPNVKQAEDLSFINLSKEINSLSQKGKEQKLSPQDILDTTFTMSNTGIFGSLMGTPIISQPQVSVIALGEIQTEPLVKQSENGVLFEMQKKMYLSLSYDHRVIDGATASKFLSSYRNLLEKTEFDSILV